MNKSPAIAGQPKGKNEMRYMATLMIAAALTAPMSVPANAWKDFTDWFKHPKVKGAAKGLGEKDCWEYAFTFGQKKKKECGF